MPKITVTIDSFRNLKQAQNLMRRAKRELQASKQWGSSPRSYTRTMLLKVDGEPVSVLCYAPVPKSAVKEDASEIAKQLAGVIVIMGAYTATKWRGQGYYQDLWKLLLKRYQDDPDYRVVRSGAHKKNLVSIAMQRKQGRDFFEHGKTHLRSRYVLRPTRRDDLLRKLNLIRARTIGLPFKEKTEYNS